MFAAAAEELGAERVCQRLLDADSEIAWNRPNTEGVRDMRDLVLKTAKRFGKARFAQVASKHVENVEWLPRYLRDAVEWLRDG